MSNEEKILQTLKELYEIEKFSLGLHTTDEEAAKAICKTGLKTGVRALEGTLKIRGDLKQVDASDLRYFFPYTTHTVVVAIPGMFDTPRITDNKGGDESLCDFSKFFRKAKWHLDNFQDEHSRGVLPSYYVMGYYNQEFEFVVNPDCFLYNEESKKQMMEDIQFVQSQIDFFNF